jgi:hypothetical protein
MALQQWINLYVFTPGRAAFAVTQLRQAAVEIGNVEIVAACDLVLAQAGTALDLEHAWAKAKTTVAGKRVKAPALDAQLDRTVSAIHSAAEGIISALPADSPLVKDALTLLSQAFPGGPGALTSLPYEDELAAVQTLDKRLTGTGDLAQVVERLQIRFLVDRLVELTGQFQEVLGVSTTRELEYSQVVDARAATQEKLLQLFVRILGTYPTERPEDVTRRTTLLAPILEQNARIAQAMKRRGTVLDVDPTTGEERDANQPVAPAPN